MWLENLNLRGNCRARILKWIHEKHPKLDSLYQDNYSRKSRDYWRSLDENMRLYTAKEVFLLL